MKNNQLLKMGLMLAIISQSQSAFSGAWVSATGYTTPTEIQLTVTNISVVNTEGREITLFSGSQAMSFKRADRDFATVALSSVIVPEGRYKKVKYTLASANWSVKLTGTRYDGSTQGSLVAGDTISTTGSTSARDSAITESTAAGNLLPNLNTPGTPSTSFSSEAPFGAIYCVAAAQSSCQSSDIWVGGPQTPPNVVFMMDLYHSVAVDGANLALAYSYVSYPFISIGSPGAAIHLSNGSGSDWSDISLFFNSNRTLAYGAVNTLGSAGIRNGNTFVSSTSENYIFAGVYTHSTGQVQIPVASRDMTLGRQKSLGLMTIANVKQSVGSTTTISCADDTSGSLGGVTYTGSSSIVASCGTAATYTITRIVDPNGILGTCTGNYISGMTGSCSNTSSSDGYP